MASVASGSSLMSHDIRNRFSMVMTSEGGGVHLPHLAKVDRLWLRSAKASP